MSIGKRYKFQGSHVKIQTSLRGGSPLAVITNFTNTDPPVVTSAAHGLSNGDVVWIDNLGGAVEANQALYIVSAKTTDTFALYGANGTNYSTWTSGGTFDPVVFSEFCEVTNWNRTGGSKTQINADSICSTIGEVEVGLAQPGSLNLSLNYAPDVLVQVALESADISGDEIAIKRQMPKNGGTRTYLGFVQQMSETAGNNGLWTASVVILLTGQSFNVAAS